MLSKLILIHVATQLYHIIQLIGTLQMNASQSFRIRDTFRIYLLLTHQIETSLSHDGMNSTQVRFYWTNSPTLPSCCTRRISLVNIEVTPFRVNMNSQRRLSCYPWRNFYPIIAETSTRCQRVTRLHSHVCSICLSYSQAYLQS